MQLPGLFHELGTDDRTGVIVAAGDLDFSAGDDAPDFVAAFLFKGRDFPNDWWQAAR